MEINLDDAIGGYVTEIGEKIREMRDEFILESLMPYAQTVESRINKQELERAIRMFYGRENLAEVVRCKDCKFCLRYNVDGAFPQKFLFCKKREFIILLKRTSFAVAEKG